MARPQTARTRVTVRAREVLGHSFLGQAQNWLLCLDTPMHSRISDRITGLRSTKVPVRTATTASQMQVRSRHTTPTAEGRSTSHSPRRWPPRAQPPTTRHIGQKAASNVAVRVHDRSPVASTMAQGVTTTLAATAKSVVCPRPQLNPLHHTAHPEMAAGTCQSPIVRLSSLLVRLTARCHICEERATISRINPGRFTHYRPMLA